MTIPFYTEDEEAKIHDIMDNLEANFYSERIGEWEDAVRRLSKIIDAKDSRAEESE